MSEPKHYQICKFDPTLKNESSDGAVIEIVNKLPEYMEFGSIERSKEFYENQAANVAYALFSSLPQGILDRVVIKLMEHKISCYRGKTES